MERTSSTGEYQSPVQHFTDLPKVATSPSSVTNGENRLPDFSQGKGSTTQKYMLHNSQPFTDSELNSIASLTENGNSVVLPEEDIFNTVSTNGKSYKSKSNNGASRDLPLVNSENYSNHNKATKYQKSGDNQEAESVPTSNGNVAKARNSSVSNNSDQQHQQPPDHDKQEYTVQPTTPNTPSDSVSLGEPVDNADDIEAEDDGEGKGRFNLRKRRFTSGSYDAFQDFEQLQSDEEDEAAGGPGYNKRKRMSGYSYDTQCLLTAANVIKNTGCSVKQAANEYGVPVSTMRRFYLMFIQGRVTYPQSALLREAQAAAATEGGGGGSPEDPPANADDIATRGVAAVPESPDSRKPAGKTAGCAMNSLEEHQLATYISLLSRSGKSIGYSDIKIIAQQILASKDKKVFRKGNVPTGGWIQKFKLRHPELEYKTLEHALMKTSSEPNIEDLTNWQSDLKLFLRLDWKLELETFFTEENAGRIFTCDEILIAFSKLDEKGEKIPLKSLLKNSNGEEKQLVTVIAAASASGDYLKPHMLLSEETSDNFPTLDTSTYSSIFSPTGLITPDIFLNWVQYFDGHLTNNNVTRPVVLLLDDHQSHFHISVFLYCLDRRIIPVCLPPKLNKLIQPLLAFFFPKLMMAYQACCKRYSSKTGNGITPDSFPYIMMKAWTLVTKSRFVTEGFRSCKLIPINVASLEAAQNVPIPPPVEPKPAATSVKVKEEPVSNHATDDDDGESSAHQEEPPPPPGAKATDPAPVVASAQQKVFKKRKIAKSPSSSQSSSSARSSIVLGDKYVSEERQLGRREGIDMCFSVLESFVPADILPVWRQRAASHSGTCEIGYCMWRAVQLLQQGGIDMAGQMQPQMLQYGQQCAE